jgi:hypothetical protein
MAGGEEADQGKERRQYENPEREAVQAVVEARGHPFPRFSRRVVP